VNEGSYCFEAKVATESRSCRIGGRGVINPVRLMIIGSDLGSPFLKYHPPGQPFTFGERHEHSSTSHRHHH